MNTFRYILLIMLLVFAGNSFAEQIDALVLQLNNGTEEVYILSDSPVLTMPEDNVVITSRDLISTYKRSEVKVFYIKKVNENESCIGSVSETAISYKFTDSNNFYVSGVPSGTIIKVTSVNGNLCLSETSDKSEVVCLSLRTLPDGIYIISFLGRSIKIKR